MTVIEDKRWQICQFCVDGYLRKSRISVGSPNGRNELTPLRHKLFSVTLFMRSLHDY